MPRYFFNIRDGKEWIDDRGTVLPGITEARAHAITTAGEMLRDHGRAFWGGTEWRMWVTEEAGVTVCALRFSAESSGPDGAGKTAPLSLPTAS